MNPNTNPNTDARSDARISGDALGSSGMSSDRSDSCVGALTSASGSLGTLPDDNLSRWSLKGTNPLTSTDQATTARPADPLRVSADVRATAALAGAMHDALHHLVDRTPALAVEYCEHTGWLDSGTGRWLDLGDILAERLPRHRPDIAAALVDVLAEASR